VGKLERRLAYEEMWRGEERDVWEWIEERVGMQDIKSTERVGYVAATKKKAVDTFANLEGMAEREVLEAIRVTKERLQRLEGAVIGNKKGQDEAKIEL